MAAPPPTEPTIMQWILDTRPLWPEAEKTAQLEIVATRALAVLTAKERAAVLRYLHVRDAKMSLGSHLLKHLAITKACPDIPWHSSTITRNAHTKPIFIHPATNTEPLSFNISHQAGLVALAAVAHYSPVEVGVDIVSPAERAARDHRMVADDGWPAFVDMHADAFGDGETAYLKYQILATMPPDAGGTADAVLDYHLRSFYTLWCLREAYIKMTGEALLAKWLGELEFRGFRPPPVAMGGEGMESGEAVREHDIWLRRGRVEDANVCLRSLGGEFMTCTAIRTPERKEDGLGFELGPFEMLDIDEILDFAESRI